MKNLRQECRDRWHSGLFVEQGHSVLVAESSNPWQRYEDYMQAQLVSLEDGVGQLLVQFPSEGSESNSLHVHPLSDRCITVIAGDGEFIARRGKALIRLGISAGTCVWMPRGILHTFFAGASGMLVESIHNPWIELSHAHCLVYPKKEVRF